MGKVKYKKCPRCELNYIPETEEMCDVCKSELGLESKLVLLDDIIDEEEPLKLCPSCKAAYIGMDEDMCENCLARASQQVSDDIDEDNDDWRTYLDDEDTPDPADDDTVIPLEELDEDDDDDEEYDEDNPDTELEDYPDDYPDDFDDDYEDNGEESDDDDDEEDDGDDDDEDDDE